MPRKGEPVPGERGYGLGIVLVEFQPGQDLRPRGRERGRTRCAGGVRRRNLGAVPTERLGERRAGHIARITIAHGVGARHELHVSPRDTGVGERGLGGDDAVLHEVASPLAPRMHPDAQHLMVVVGAAERDRIWEQRIRAAVARLERHVEVEYLSGLV
jgi:hypothetical protein